jgi:hypothetical protein
MRALIIPLFIGVIILISSISPVHKPVPPQLMAAKNLGQAFAMVCHRVIGLVAIKAQANPDPSFDPAPTASELQGLYGNMSSSLQIQVYVSPRPAPLTVQCWTRLNIPSASAVALISYLVADPDVGLNIGGTMTTPYRAGAFFVPRNMGGGANLVMVGRVL